MTFIINIVKNSSIVNYYSIKRKWYIYMIEKVKYTQKNKINYFSFLFFKEKSFTRISNRSLSIVNN
jgi:hypothetical protein